MWKVALPMSLVVLGLAFVLGSGEEHWSGGFPDAIYELHFVDRNGEDVPDVELDMLAIRGSSWNVPIENWNPDGRPVSDGDGRMTLYSIDHDFGGHCKRWFFVFSSGGCDPPSYQCRLSVNGRIVHTMRFDELANAAWDARADSEVVERPKPSVEGFFLRLHGRPPIHDNREDAEFLHQLGQQEFQVARVSLEIALDIEVEEN